MRQLLYAVEWHGAATVSVRVDEGCQRDRSFDKRVEGQAKLPQRCQVRPVSSRADDLIDRGEGTVTAPNNESVGSLLDSANGDTHVESDTSCCYCLANVLTEPTALRELVAGAAQSTGQGAAPHCPVHSSACFLLGQPNEVQ